MREKEKEKSFFKLKAFKQRMKGTDIREGVDGHRPWQTSFFPQMSVALFCVAGGTHERLTWHSRNTEGGQQHQPHHRRCARNNWMLQPPQQQQLANQEKPKERSPPRRRWSTTLKGEGWDTELDATARCWTYATAAAAAAPASPTARRARLALFLFEGFLHKLRSDSHTNTKDFYLFFSS